MKKEDRERLKKYLKKRDALAKKLRLTGEDLANLYDLLYIADTPREIPFEFRATLKANNLFEWYKKLFEKVERIVVPELYTKRKKRLITFK
jgi:hypothetical protein